MALRARTKKRQGGSSRGGGRPSVVVGQNPAHGTIASGTTGFSNGAKSGFQATTTPQAPASPSAPYQRRPAPQATVPTAGPSSTALRNSATSALGIARNQNRDAVFRAIMQLGDPEQIAKYKNDSKFAGYDFTQDPNSVFASLARQEQEGLEQIDEGTLSGNTFFSGMRLRDRGRLTDETGRQRLAGTTSFLDDLKAYAAALGLAENDYTTAMSNADQMDIDAALEADRIAREQWIQEQAALGSESATSSASQSATPQYGTQPDGTYKTDPSTQWGSDYEEKKGHDSKGNPGVWHIYPDGRKVFVRKKK